MRAPTIFRVVDALVTAAASCSLSWRSPCVLLITSLRGIAGFYTDYLWFDSLGHVERLAGRARGQGRAWPLIFTGVFFVLMWVNLVIADRLAPPFRPPGPRRSSSSATTSSSAAGPARSGSASPSCSPLIAGAGVSSQWNAVAPVHQRASTSASTDPQFDTDIGFYVFQLPFLQFVVDWLFAALRDRPASSPPSPTTSTAASGCRRRASG